MLQTRFDVWGEIDECVIGDLDESGSGLVIEGWTEKAGGAIVDVFVDCWTWNVVDAGVGFVLKGFVDVSVDCWTCSVVDVVTGLVIKGWTEKAGGALVDFFVDCWTCNIVVDGAGFVIKGWTEGTDRRFVDVFVDCWTCSVVDAETGGFVECCVDVYDDIWAFVVLPSFDFSHGHC